MKYFILGLNFKIFIKLNIKNKKRGLKSYFYVNICIVLSIQFFAIKLTKISLRKRIINYFLHSEK